MKTQPTRTMSGKILCCFVILFMAFAARSYAGPHVTMSITNCSATSNQFQFDMYLLNDGDQSLKFNSASFRMTHSTAIFPGGAYNTFVNTYSIDYIGGTDFTAAFANRPTTYNMQYTASSRLMQLTMSTGNYVEGNAISLPIGVPMKVGRFSMTILTSTSPNGANWTAGASIGMAYFSSGNGAVLYTNGATTSSNYNQTTPATTTLLPPCNAVIPQACANRTMTVSAISNVSCNGGSNGSATATLSSGVEPISWTVNGNPVPGTTTSISITGLSAGSHAISSTDAQGCIVGGNVSITEPGPIASDYSVTACDSYTLPWNGPVTTSGDYTHTYTTSAGCDSVVTAHVTINYSSSSSETATACDSYTWAENGQTYTTSGTYTSTSTNASGCPHTATLNLTVNYSSSSSETATACDSYTWAENGQTYTVSGTYTNVTTNASGCPHTATLNLTVNYSTSSSETATACDSYTWAENGQTYTVSGTYTNVTTNASGCPHTATLNLTVNYSTSSSETATACDSYTWAENGQTYTTSGTYTNVSTNASGCPHTATLNLTVNYSSSSSETATACDSYTWAVDGNTYTVSGTYTHVGTNASGCPHTTTLNLTVNYSTSSSETATACDSYTWAENGQTYTVSGTYTNVTTNASGCPHTATLNLTVNYSSSTSETATACDSYTWSVNGQTYTTSGTYTHVTTNASGCPHTATLDLTVNYSTSSSETATACDSYTWAENGQTYTTSGTYTNVSTNASGCPHTATLNLTVNYSTSSSETATACDSYTWAENGQTYTVSGTYTNVTTNASGCPHTATLNLTVNYSSSSSETATACDSYTWAVDGQTYTTSGTYTHVGTNASGCPHTTTLNLTVNYSSSSSETATACDSYTWAVDGNTYTVSGTYTHVGTNASGCPHTTTLNLTVNYSSSSSETATACDSYTWAENGQTYTTSGTYTNVTTNASGCPHTATLNLTVNYSTSSSETATACDSYTWAVDGQTYTTSGTYTHVGTNASGCPHTTTLNLTVNYSSSSSETATACDSYTWAENGQTYTTSGTYTNVSTNASGCPHTATLNLTVNYSTSSSETATACDSYTWAENGQTYTTSGTYTNVTTNASGCPHTATLNLTVNYSSSSSETATACDSYTWAVDGQTYTTSGTYTHVGTNASGCPHTTTLNLTVNYSSSSSETATACDSYTWAENGQTYTTSGTYTNVSTNASGCPHTATLNLTVNYSTSSSETATACDSYTWAENGQTYTTSGTYTNVTTNASGCPHTATLNLTVNYSSSSSETATACDSYTWAVDGQTYTTSGTYTHVGTNASGCPHTTTLDLTVNYSSSSSETATACDSYTWAENGQTYTTSGTYTNVSTNASGCPHTATLNLTVNYSTSSSETATACDSYTWAENGQTYTTSGTYTNVTTNASGCPHTATLNLTVNYSSSSSETATACDSYTWAVDGQTYTTSGTYTHVGTNASGCPHTTTLNLTVNYSSSSSETATACDSYTWAENGQTYTTSGTYTNVTTNASGCPHTATLNLTVNYSSSSSETATACDSYTWAENGQTYTTSGTYTHSSTNASGCPHSATLNLTVNYSSSSSETATACDSYTWSVNGQTYTTSGTYTHVGTNASGCPHTTTLDLTVNYSTSSSETATACDSYTWAENGQTYTTSGTYTNVTTNASGCPHTATLNLTVNYSSSSTDNVTTCGSYTWPANGQTYTTSGTYTHSSTNASGCPHSSTLNLTILDPITVTVTYDPIACYGGTTCITVSATGGSGNYSGTGTFCGYGEGTHVITVTDDANCEGSETITLTEPTKVNVTTTTTPSGCGSNDGTATADATGGTGGYSYLWSNGNTNQTATGLGGGTYTVQVTDANGCTGTASATVTSAGSTPPAPGTISGAGGCRGTCTVYSIEPVAGATSYTWTLPAGATGSSTGTSITVCFSTRYDGGSICVKANSPCGTSSSSCKSVPKVGSKPSKPGNISGPAKICQSALPITNTYCIASVPGATNYFWYVDGSASFPMTITGGQGTTCVTVHFPIGYNGNQKLKVKAENCKGLSSDRYIKVEFQEVPDRPGSISGSSSQCKSASNQTYSINSVSGASSYTWSVSNGATITSGQGTTSIMINFSTGTTGTAVISVVANNACGSSVAKTKNVTVNNCRLSATGEYVSGTSAVNSLTAYPNPTSGKATVTFTADRNAKYSLKVFNVIGKVMVEENISAVEGYNMSEINLESVSAGIYFISVQTDGEQARSLRLIVE